MKLHGNARLTPHGRERLVRQVLERGTTVRDAADAAGISTRTAAKWVARYRREGTLGLIDRPSVARRIPHRTGEDRVAGLPHFQHTEQCTAKGARQFRGLEARKA